MNFKKMKKRFFSLSRGNGGFTLVELIVVIAVLAILGGVAVPAYSGYVEKTNKQSDISLMGEIEHALHLGYYSGLDVSNGYVVLSYGGNASCEGEGVAKAMAATFGDTWNQSEALHLKYNWLASFEGSSYQGNEQKIITNIDTLTDALSDTINTLGGDQFKAYYGDLGVNADDKNAVADAAVFYIANQISGMSNGAKENIITNLPANVSKNDSTEILGAFIQQGMTPVVAAASVYAVAEGLCTQLNDAEVTKVFNDEVSALQGKTFEDQNEAAAAVITALQKAQQKANDNGHNQKLVDYFAKGQAGKDMTAYFDMMTAVAGADRQIKDSLGTDGCFANLGGLVNSVTGGGAVMYLQAKNDEVVVINTAIAE